MCSSLGRKHARLDFKRSATALQPVLSPGGEAFSVVARLSPHPLHGFSSAVLFIHAWLDVGDDLREFPMQIKLISTGSELSLMLQMRSTCMSKRPALVMRNLSSVFLFFSL